MNTPKAFERIFLTAVTVWLTFECTSFARPPEESEFVAAGILGDDIAAWFHDIEPRPKSLGLFSLRSNSPLDQDYSAIVESEIYKGLSRRSVTNVMSCSECRVPQISVQEDRLVITKGVPDVETLKKIGLKYPVESFMTVDIFRSKLTVVAQVVLYASPSGEVIKAERFTVSALNFADAAVQVTATYGPGKIVGTGADSSKLQMAANLSLLEEVGVGKAGLTLGAMFGGSTTIIYVNPTLSLRGRYGNSALAYSVNLGVGYGIAGEARGISVGGSYDIYMGSLTVFGVEGLYLSSLTSTTSPFGGYVGFHLGISIGR